MINIQIKADIIEWSVRMTEKYELIWDFCDWVGYQGWAYERLYYGDDEQIDDLIRRYFEDNKWIKGKGYPDDR